MRLRRNQKGATLVEYAILAGGLAAATISGIYMVGTESSETFQKAADQVEKAREDMGAVTGPTGPAPEPIPDPSGPEMLLTYEATNAQITVPLNGAVNVTIDWGGANASCPTTVTTAGDIGCTYDTPGTYTVSILGSIEQFGSDGWEPVPNAANLVSVDSWGDTGLQKLYQSFKGASNLQTVPSNLPSTVWNMQAAFTESGYNGAEVTSWDTSNVLNMSYMFRNTNFTQDISSWNTSKVQTMEGMFSGASIFNQPIGSWDTSSVHNTGYMFNNAVKFNQDLTGWDMSGVTWAESMFSGATDFNGDISSWDVSELRNMVSMFKDATSFNSNIGSWNTMNMEYMTSAFRNATSFNQNIGGWNTANVQLMDSVFRDAAIFNQDLSSWNTSRADSMYEMFQDAIAFNSDLSGWCVSRIGSKPANFDTGATSWVAGRPVWGSCP